MKKLVSIMIALMTAMQAQAGLLPSLKWGIKGGMDYQVNDFKSAAENIDIKSNTGWYAGLQGELTWGMFGIRPELIYSHNKFDVEGAGSSMKLSKLDLPILAQLKFLGVLSIQVGPTFCLMTNTSGSADGYEWSVERPTVGYAVGAEARIWKLAVSARYNGSFKDSEVMGFTTGENKISTVQLGVGFYF